MRKYYFAEGEERRGPFSLEEMASKDISKESLIWYEGLDNWIAASEVPELLQQIMPPMDSQTTPSISPQVTSPIESPVDSQITSSTSPNITSQNSRAKRQYNAPVRPKTWLVESIVLALICCQIFGIIAIVYAAKVDSCFNRGDHAAAYEASNKAKMWFFIGLGSGLFLFLLYIIFVVVIENLHF